VAGREVAHRRRGGRILTGDRKEKLDVIVEPQGRESLQRIAGQHDANHIGRHSLDSGNGQKATLQFVPESADLRYNIDGCH
jgi:hypothetical protein